MLIDRDGRRALVKLDMVIGKTDFEHSGIQRFGEFFYPLICDGFMTRLVGGNK